MIRRDQERRPTRTGSPAAARTVPNRPRVLASNMAMSTFFQDLKFGVRLLAKTPGFTLIAALSLALGIGANTTIFTLINAVLLNPLPVDDPSRLVSIWTTDERNQGNLLGFLQLSPMNYKDLRDKNEVFTDVAAHQGIPLSLSVTGGEPQQVFGEIVTGNYFSVL